MSTSSEFAWQAPPSLPDVHPFDYPAIGSPGSTHPSGRWTPQPVATPAAISDTQELRKREQRARDEGIREGELRARLVFEEALAVERASVTQAIEQFANERTSYYQRVESEVVQLALAIARKVIHREVQLDPLLLSGAVEVALRRLDRNTRVLMRVHPAHAQDWRAHFAQQHLTIEVVEDPAIISDRCLLQTSLGNTEIGIEPQLKEIENGFFDLLAQLPNAAVTQAVQ